MAYSDSTLENRTAMAEDALSYAKESLCKEGGMSMVIPTMKVKTCLEVFVKEKDTCREFIVRETLESDADNLLSAMKTQAVRCLGREVTKASFKQ